MQVDKEPPSTVRNVMTEPLVTIEKDCSVHEAAKTMTEKHIGCIVVTDRDAPTGIVTERDILQRVVAEGLNAQSIRIKDIMTKPLISIKADEQIVDAIRTMQKREIRRLLVKEEERIVGIVTQRDLLRALVFHVLISFRPLLSK